MSKIVSLIGQRFVLTNRLSASLSSHVNQTKHLSSATSNYGLEQYQNNPVGLIRSHPTTHISKRYMYDPQSLGIESLERHRSTRAQLYERDREGYVGRISKYLEDPATNSILLEDLINMIGLAENEEHLDLIERMIVNIINHQNFSISGWGTAVMRLYYQMNQVDRAYNNIRDTARFGEFFNSYSSYRIALTMLFNKERYDEVLDIYQQAISRLKKPNGHKSQPGLAVVALAALAKQKGVDKFEEAKEIYYSVGEQECPPYLRLRLASLMAYIAVNSNHPSIALNLIAETVGKSYVSLREIKALALLKLNRYEDALYHIRESLTKASHIKDVRRPLFHRDIFDVLKNAECDIEDENIRHEYGEVLEELEKSQLVQNNSLDIVIFAPIVLRPRPKEEK